MNYGSHVRDLLLELKRSEDGVVSVDASNSASASVPSYNDGLVTLALQDFQLHLQALHDQVVTAKASAVTPSDKPALEVRPSMLLQTAACQRNKRGLLAYHWIRLQRIQEHYYWQNSEQKGGQAQLVDDNDTDGSQQQQNTNFCPAESDFLEKYHDLVSQYTSAALPGSIIPDLRGFCTAPPLTVDRILCRVVDATTFSDGPIVLESGQTVSFTAGSMHYLLFGDCEEYVRSGALQVLETEEQ